MATSASIWRKYPVVWKFAENQDKNITPFKLLVMVVKYVPSTCQPLVITMLM